MARSAAPKALVVAIDGPSGTGKSTVARALARNLGIGYLDTGALYRLVTLYVLQRGIDPTDHDAVAGALGGLTIDAPTSPDEQQHYLHGEEVTGRIRDTDVTGAVSAVSANPAVREFLLEKQRSYAYFRPMVLEGRDIGTVVVPDALVKVYLTADAGVRAERRFRQEMGADVASGLEDVAAGLQRRDEWDTSRTVAPLAAADDAVVVDSTSMTVDETVEAAMTAIRANGFVAEIEPAALGSRPVAWRDLGGQGDPVPTGRTPRNVDRGRRIGIALSYLMYRMKIRGEEHIPAEGPVVFVANHTTFADGPVLFGRLPRRTSFLVKAEVLVGPLGWLLRTVGQYSIDRAAPQREVLMAALAQLKGGGVIGIFPEGERTDGSVTEVFNGAGWMATRSGATVVPVALRGTARPPGRALRRFRPPVFALIGTPVRVNKGAGRRAVDAATGAIQERLSATVADLDRGIVAAQRYRALSGPGWRHI